MRAGWVRALVGTVAPRCLPHAAVHLAVQAAQQGRNVALLDTDPQQSAARWGDRRAAALPVVLTVPPSRLAAELQRCADAGTDLAIIDTPPRAACLPLIPRTAKGREGQPYHRSSSRRTSRDRGAVVELCKLHSAGRRCAHGEELDRRIAARDNRHLGGGGGGGCVLVLPRPR